MTRVRNTLAHMKGQVISVNGRSYQLDQDGEVKIGNPDDATKLLGGKTWKLVPEPVEVETAPIRLDIKIKPVVMPNFEPVEVAKPELVARNPIKKRGKKTKK
jgi:hypothetical protein